MPRIERVNKLLKREISNMILFREINDPRVSFVTIMSVEVSKDLQHARVKFSTLSDEPEDIKDAIEGLNSCRGYIRKLISQRVDMRTTPEFNFVYDKSAQYAARLDQTLEEIKQHNTARGEHG